jgi:hypothetical protein
VQEASLQSLVESRMNHIWLSLGVPYGGAQLAQRQLGNPTQGKWLLYSSFCDIPFFSSSRKSLFWTRLTLWPSPLVLPGQYKVCLTRNELHVMWYIICMLCIHFRSFRAQHNSYDILSPNRPVPTTIIQWKTIAHSLKTSVALCCVTKLHLLVALLFPAQGALV